HSSLDRHGTARDDSRSITQQNGERIITRFLFTFGIVAWFLSGPFASGSEPRLPLPLKVVKNQVLNSRNERVHLRGVNAASLEWTSDGEGRILNTVKTAIHDWH